MFKPSKTTTWALAAGGLALTAYAGISQVHPQQIGLRDTFYLMTGNVLKPKIYFQVPFVQYTHKYEANTQSINFNAGSGYWLPFAASTKDQNPLMADLVVHYRVTADRERLAFHRWEMEKWFTGENGYWPISGLINISANAVLGQKSMEETLRDPKAFTEAVYNDLTSRLDLNNFPVEVQSVELKGFKTSMFAPVRTIDYEVVGNPQGKSAPPPAPN